MPEQAMAILFERGVLGVAVVLLILALIWAVREIMAAQRRNEALQEARLQDQLSIAERDRDIARESATLASECKSALEQSSKVVDSVLLRGGGQ